jgi:folate-binding protein YgfZ
MTSCNARSGVYITTHFGETYAFPTMSTIFLKGSRVPFICSQCQLRAQRRKVTTSARLLAVAGSPVESTNYARLTSRSLIRLEGPDAAEFFQGLVPAKLNNLSTEEASRPIYTAFLTAQGRITHDVFIYPPTLSTNTSNVWHIEVDVESASELVKHLRKHKLRSKFKMERMPQEMMSVYSMWPLRNSIAPPETLAGEGAMGGTEPRPQMGSRWILSPDSASDTLKELLGQPIQEAGLLDYTVHRILNGIAEGQEEIIALSALPQESNIDFFGGIDFHKGCYLGQELTIRTHHTGVVRKRILPCQIYNQDDPIDPSQEAPIYNSNTKLKLPISGSNISKLVASSKRSTGKWLSGTGNIGLALCRLEMMTDLSVTDEPSEFDSSVAFKVVPPKDSTDAAEVLIRPFVPPWLRAKIEESKARRIKKRPKGEEDSLDVD